MVAPRPSQCPAAGGIASDHTKKVHGGTCSVSRRRGAGARSDGCIFESLALSSRQRASEQIQVRGPLEELLRGPLSGPAAGQRSTRTRSPPGWPGWHHSDWHDHHDEYPSPPRSPWLVRHGDGQTSPHKPRLVVSHSTCPPLSPSPHWHANSFEIGPAV
jgi:hypothetical protein